MTRDNKFGKSVGQYTCGGRYRQKVPSALGVSWNCVGALKFASGNWLQPLENEAHDLMLLTPAAYLFQSAQAFKEITKALILNHNGPYLALSCEEVESALTWRLFCKYLNDQFGHLEHVTDWLMYRSARRTKKPSKAETSRNTNSRNKRRD